MRFSQLTNLPNLGSVPPFHTTHIQSPIVIFFCELIPFQPHLIPPYFWPHKYFWIQVAREISGNYFIHFITCQLLDRLIALGAPTGIFFIIDCIPNKTISCSIFLIVLPACLVSILFSAIVSSFWHTFPFMFPIHYHNLCSIHLYPHSIPNRP